MIAGMQLGGQAYSEIIFFEDQRALKDFTNGNFEFGADASVVAITADAGANAATTGSSAGASAGKKDATTVGAYHKGMATFTVAKGGLMYEAEHRRTEVQVHAALNANAGGWLRTGAAA